MSYERILHFKSGEKIFRQIFTLRKHNALKLLKFYVRVDIDLHIMFVLLREQFLIKIFISELKNRLIDCFESL